MEAHCATLGPRFRFYHYGHVKGFKAGALNIALELTGPDVKYIAVIDSDYRVEPNWLRLTLPLFAAPEIALVQGPQDYSDAHDSIFKAMAFEEYRGFFQIGMVERNEHNAIIQHGTMTIVRHDALREVGRLEHLVHHRGYRARLTPVRGGLCCGLSPAKHGDGADPRHAESLPEPALSLGLWRDADFETSRGRYFPGQFAAVLGAALSVPQRLAALDFRWARHGGYVYGIGLDIPDVGRAALYRCADACLTAGALALFAAKMLKTLLLYPQKVGSGVKGALMASVAGLSLTHTVGKAVWAGLFTSGKPFLRTPKCADQALLSQALRGVWQETALFALCLLAIVSLFATGRYDDPSALLWMVMLGVQSLPYAATIVTAVLSARSLAKHSQTPTLPAEAPKAMAKAA